MRLKEALQDTGLVEAWYEGYTAIVAKEREGYRLFIHHGNNPPHFVHDGLSLEQIEAKISIMGAEHPLDWHPIELEG